MATYEYLVCDIATDTQLVDLSNYATAKLQPRLSRPFAVTLDTVGDAPGLLDTTFDGDPNTQKGNRCLKVKRNGTLIANNRIQKMSWTADTRKTGRLQLITFCPMPQLTARWCFDATGRVADFSFPSPTTGATMLSQLIAHSVTYEDAPITLLGVTYFPAVLPIDYTGGALTATVDLAATFTDTPKTIGELIGTLTATGALDVVLTPTDTSLLADPGILAQLQVVDRWGSDISATVHFDYGTGIKNVISGRRDDGIDTLCNRLIYELGPKKSPDVWQGNISGTETGAAPGSEDLTAWQHAQLLSREKYGTWGQFRVFDDNDTENTDRKLFHALWKTESTMRVNGRDLIYITPLSGAGGVYLPFDDYNVGDSVGINTADGLLGPALTGDKIRIYGFDLDVDDKGKETPSELITSMDGL